VSIRFKEAESELQQREGDNSTTKKTARAAALIVEEEGSRLAFDTGAVE